eukprot:6326716-Amphidinium_carterae.1
MSSCQPEKVMRRTLLRDTWLEEAKVRDDGDNIIKKSLEKQLQAHTARDQRCAVRCSPAVSFKPLWGLAALLCAELERQGVLMRSLCKALEDHFIADHGPLQRMSLHKPSSEAGEKNKKGCRSRILST